MEKCEKRFYCGRNLLHIVFFGIKREGYLLPHFAELSLTALPVGEFSEGIGYFFARGIGIRNSIVGQLTEDEISKSIKSFLAPALHRVHDFDEVARAAALSSECF